MSDRSSSVTRAGTYMGIAAVSLVIGAGGAVLALRWLDAPKEEAAAWSAATAGSTVPGAKEEPMAGMDMSGEEGPGSAGAVYISPARQQLIGVRTAPVESRTLDVTIRAVGTLAYDETRVTEIHPRVSGWVEEVFVDFVGKPVRRGQRLLTVHSPELVATQNEYLLALKAFQQLGTSAFPETRSGAESLVAAARDRLGHWGMTDAQIDELERSREVRRTTTLYSPFDGIVLERNTYAGQYITPETSTAKVADLSTIWAIGQVFEYEAHAIKIGDRAEIEFPYGQSSRRLTGRVTFIYPDINPDTRRARVRIEFRNPGLELKPETYVTVILRRSAPEHLAIPKEALLDNGDKRFAIVSHPNGYFEPREIEIGEPVDQYYPVLEGLTPGDRVVTSAQFLIDSETNLQAALGAMANMPGMNMGGDKDTPAAAPEHQHNQR